VGAVYGHMHTFFVHLAGVLLVISYTVVMSWILYKVTDSIIPLRVDEEQEAQGLDLSQHSESMGEPAVRELEPESALG
jgi:Amt family ammonium transporter